MNGRHLLGACHIVLIVLFLFSFLSNAEDLGELISPINQTKAMDYEKIDKYGITFEHPKEWKIKDEEGVSSRGSVTLYKLDRSGSSIYTSTIRILWDDSMANVDPTEYLNLLAELYEQEKNITNVDVEDSSSVIIDGNEAAMKVMSLEYTSGSICKNRHVAFTSSSSKRWIRMDHSTLPEVDDEAAFNHIVVSFHDSQKAKS